MPNLFLVFGCVALVSGILSLPGFLRGFPVALNGLGALQGWSVQADGSGANEGKWYWHEREWTAYRESLKCHITVIQTVPLKRPNYGLIGSSMYPHSVKIPPLGRQSYQLFSRANVICQVNVVRTRKDVDWLSWPHTRTVEETVRMTEIALPIAKAIDRQIMLAIYPRYLFVASLLGMVITLYARRPRKVRSKPRRATIWRNRWE